MTRLYEQVFSWPNILTFVRILIIPVLVIFYYLPFSGGHLLAAILFALASITDWLDGYLARYLQQSTKLGAFLDPVADKLMVCVVLVLLVAEPTFQYVRLKTGILLLPAALMTVPAAVIVAREIIVSALREWMAEIGKRSNVAVSSVGKFKTAVQMVALTILLYCSKMTAAPIIFIGFILLYVAAVLTIWSMFIYLKAAWVQLRAEFL